MGPAVSLSPIMGWISILASNKENGDETKEDNSMNKDRYRAGLHVAKINNPATARATADRLHHRGNRFCSRIDAVKQPHRELLARINVNTNSQNEDGEDRKEEESVDQNCLAIGCEAAVFNMTVVAG
ncbi:hypothetical protein JRO89_XS01G0399400 [Xanthoceras sorbifolium]|uniref:Uncharacterized protein n=1 Tax=Xanthoceras sorbifolium TaxID=99658 RepID=A0ABQ8IPD4_9ROSI|nr:hypothetical protein JRO89_XS01G0399400 [Xanthoceras sorbifolium]